MGFWLYAIGAGVIGGLLHKSRKDDAIKEEERRQAEALEEERISTPCDFDEGITEEEFSAMVQRAGRGLSQLFELYNDGPKVHGGFTSQSGKSDYYFTIDFNDFGQLTGKYWLTDYSDSVIPSTIARRISHSISRYPESVEPFYQANERRTDNNNPKENLSSEDQAKYAEIRAEERIERARLANERKIEQTRIKEAEQTEREKLAAEERKRNDSRGLIAILLLLLMTMGLLFYNFYLHKDDPPKVAVTYSAKDFVGMDYNEVKSILRKDGFTDISFTKEADIVLGFVAKEGEVKKVTINGSSKFKSGDKFDEDAKVVIIYHVRK